MAKSKSTKPQEKDPVPPPASPEPMPPAAEPELDSDGQTPKPVYTQPKSDEEVIAYWTAERKKKAGAIMPTLPKPAEE